MHFPRRGWIALLPLPEERAFFSELKHHLFEGAELPVLQGARRTLVAHRPQLAISIDHSKQDMVRIPLWLESVLKGYAIFWGITRVPTGTRCGMPCPRKGCPGEPADGGLVSSGIDTSRRFRD